MTEEERAREKDMESFNRFQEEQEKKELPELPKLEEIEQNLQEIQEDLEENDEIVLVEKKKILEQPIKKEEIIQVPPNNPIEDKETLGWLEKKAIKRLLKVTRKRIPKLVKKFQEGIRQKEEIIQCILGLTEVLEIEEEYDTGKKDEKNKPIMELRPVTYDNLITKSEEKLLTDLEEALNEVQKLM